MASKNLVKDAVSKDDDHEVNFFEFTIGGLI